MMELYPPTEPKLPSLKVADPGIFENLKASKFFEEYCIAFKMTTGLSLDLTRSDEIKFALCSRTHGNNLFCQLMSEKGVDCETCRLLNLEVWEQLRSMTELDQCGRYDIHTMPKSPQTMHLILSSQWEGPQTFECFAGMCETMVPVKINNRLIGFLKTGQVLMQEPTREAFQQALIKIGELTSGIDAEKIEKAYFETPVVPPSQYEAMVTLLKSFAEQISRSVEQLQIAQNHDDPKIVQKAKEYIHDHFDTPMTLEMLADATCTSPSHLSRVFKQTTGIGYLEYLNQFRVEKSMKLLKQRDLRISEIAFQVGFQSLAPFNRTFRVYAGMTPKAYRAF